VQPQSNDHTHPELEAGLKLATDVLLEIRLLLDTRLGAIEARIGALETRFSALETRFSALETRFTIVEARLGRIEVFLRERLGRNGQD